ncbi:MAG: malonyl-CoA synthase [SAR86 cluster bacterium]|uniref:Malonyl-CoA synthase n=1 Tax=SAR86 cluster bacterium TaxID=2030880 RepID=A0A2A5CI84_9GAMM|nr:AMP-binding protein [bacterium AH-315-I11]PCJ43594.1 MAG: malonyl-CoA synthase [SAR86 cluster bacterium]
MTKNANFFLSLQQGIQSSLSKPCIDGPDFPVLSYSELADLTAQAANLLKSLGVKAGARVLVQTQKTPLGIAFYLACLRSGAIYVPLNIAYTADELDYFIEDTEPNLFVCDSTKRKTLEDLFSKHNIPTILEINSSGQGSLLDQLNAFPKQHEIVHVDADDIAVILYTSGTTGKPKGAMLSHDNLNSNAQSLYKIWDWQKDDVLIHALPIFHIHGLFVALHLSLLGGTSMLFLSRFDAGQITQLLPQASVLMGVPTFYTRLLQQDSLNSDLCKNMRLFVSGSAPLLEETSNFFAERSGHRILERYGMSETGMLMSNPLDGEKIPGTVGFALPDVSYRVCDDDGNTLSPGSIGTLHVKGPNIFQGYWRNPEKTKQEFKEGYFITGDLVNEDSDGRISIVGRNKDLIISGGYNVYPKEVELVMDEFEAISESAVIGVSHPDFGEAVVAVVVQSNLDQKLDEQEIINNLKNRLAAYKVPKKIFVKDELPRNTMGKVQKNLLRNEYDKLFK